MLLNVSIIPSLSLLCLNTINKLINNKTWNNKELIFSQRLLLFKLFLKHKRITKDILKILINGGSSRYFLNKYNEISFINYNITDECIELILKLLPIKKSKNDLYGMKLDFSDNLQLYNPTITNNNDNILYEIQSISFKRCKCLNSLDLLLQFHPQYLNIIDLSYCWSLKSNIIGTIGNIFTNLKSISLNNLSVLTDNDLLNIINNNKDLRIIEVRGCLKLTSLVIYGMISNKLQLRRLSLPDNRKITCASILHFLIVCGYHLTSFDCPSFIMNPWIMISFPYCCPFLINLSLYQIDVRWLLLLLHPTYDNLQLYIRGQQSMNHEDSFTFWDNKLSSIFNTLSLSQQENTGIRYVNSLKDITISSLLWDDNIAKQFFKHTINLSNLTIHGCRTLGIDTFNAINQSNCLIKSIDYGYSACSCNELESFGSLNMTNLSYLFADSCLKDNTVLSWLQSNRESCKKIIYISARWSDGFRDKSAIPLLQQCGKSLRYLDIALCYFLSKNTFNTISKYCPYITDLNICSIPSISDEIIDILCLSCKHIKKLNLSHDSLLTDNAIYSITTQLPELITLYLDNLIKLTDYSIILISYYINNRLEHLSLSGIRNLTDKCLTKYLLKSSNLWNINLSGTRFSSNALCEYFNISKQLYTINISHQPNINNNVIKSLVTIPFLQDLDISECINITNESISFISTCSHLEYLNLQGCTGIDGNLSSILTSNNGHISIKSPNNIPLSGYSI